MIKKEIQRFVKKYTLKALIRGLIAHLQESPYQMDKDFAEVIQAGYDEWIHKDS